MTDFQVLADPDAVAHEAALFFDHLISEADGPVDIFLTGGSTPEKLYKKLATSSIDWKNVRLFIGDDRFVDVTDSASNWGMIQRTLLDHIDIPQENLFPMPTPHSGMSIDEAADAYAKCLPDHPDLILLGMGEDGHTASLFPGKPSLKVTDKLVVSSPPGVLPPPVERITLTFPAINSAKQIFVLVTGEKKHEKLKDWSDKKGTVETLPVLGLDPDGPIVVFADRAAWGEQG
jgi:6-phosphogluconolactonase